jgi:hypothetical protein
VALVGDFFGFFGAQKRGATFLGSSQKKSPALPETGSFPHPKMHGIFSANVFQVAIAQGFATLFLADST